MCCRDVIGTRAEREWLATFRRIASALERIADRMEERAGAGTAAEPGEDAAAGGSADRRRRPSPEEA